MTVAIPDATAAHIIRQGGKGLKQLHNISGARVSAIMLKSGLRDERHVSIRGTDEQIGDALVVLGKRLAQKRVRGPTTKKMVPKPSADWVDPVPPRVASKPHTGPSAPPSGQRPSSHNPALGPVVASPGPSAEKWNPSATALAFSSRSFTPATSFHGVSLHPPTPTQPYSSTPVSRSQSMGESPTSPGPPSVAMASPSPTSTAFTPTVAMASPSPSGSVTPRLPDGCWRCGGCCPPPANCSSWCALLGQGYLTVPSVRRGAEPSGGGRCKGTADESLTSLAVYFRNWHMFREDMNNIPC